MKKILKYYLFESIGLSNFVCITSKPRVPISSNLNINKLNFKSNIEVSSIFFINGLRITVLLQRMLDILL